MTQPGQSLRYLRHTLTRNAGLTAAIAVTLALGTSAVICVFALANAIFLRPLPYADEDRVVMVWSPRKADPVYQTVSFPDLFDWRIRATSFEGLAAYNVAVRELGGRDRPESTPGAVVDERFFTVLGVQPSLGRAFQDAAQPDDELVISHGLWVRRYRQDPSVIGTSVEMSGRTYTIVGVLPTSFEHPEPLSSMMKPEFWIPFSAAELQRPRGFRYLRVVGRLKPGVSVRAAQGEMTVLAERLGAEHPDTNGDFGSRIVPIRGQLFGQAHRSLLILTIAAAAMLIIACLNVTHLQLAHVVAREHELQVRIALGASPARLIRLLLGDSIVIATLGAAGGLALAFYVLGSVVPLLIDLIPQSLGTRLAAGLFDARVVLFSAVCAVGAVAMTSLIPAMRMLNMRLASLASGSDVGGLDRRWRAMRTAVVGTQIALAFPLLVGSLLLGRSLYELTSVPPGFDTRNVLTFQLAPPNDRYKEASSVRILATELRDRLASLPDVQSATVTFAVPLSGVNTTFTEKFWLRSATGAMEEREVSYRIVDEHFFRTLKMSVKEGRGFDASDAAGQRVGIVNDAFARVYLQGQEAIGSHLRIGPSAADAGELLIVGVVHDVRYESVDAAPAPEVYVPFGSSARSPFSLMLRTAGAPTTLVPEVRRTIWQSDPLLPIGHLQTMDDIVAKTTVMPRVAWMLGSASAFIAVVLALIGVGGLTSYLVNVRTHEYCIKLAVGATQGRILLDILRQTISLGAMGLVAGLVLTSLGQSLLQHLLVDLVAADPLSLLAAIGIVGVCMSLAAYLPARRVFRVEPAMLLTRSRF